MKIDVMEGRLTFDVVEDHAEFGLYEDYKLSPSSLPCCGCDLVDSDKFMELVDVCQNDPHEFNYVSTKGSRLDYVKVDLVDNLTPNIVKD